MAARRPRTLGTPRAPGAPRTSRPPADPQRAYYAGVREGDLQAAIIGLCQRMGHLVFHDPDARRCRHCGQMQFDKRVRGFPDLMIVRMPKRGLRGPWLILAELKTERGQLSTEQRVWRTYLSVAAKLCPGVLYAVWRPHDWPMIQRLLSEEAIDDPLAA